MVKLVCKLHFSQNTVVVGNVTAVHVVHDVVQIDREIFAVKDVVNEGGACTKAVAGVVDGGEILVGGQTSVVEQLCDPGVDGAVGLAVVVTADDSGHYRPDRDYSTAAREILLAKITEDDILAGKVISSGSFLKKIVSKLTPMA